MWVTREKLTGLPWPQIALLALLAGAIDGVVAFWWDLDQDWFPVLALATWAVVLVSVALARLVTRIHRRYDDDGSNPAVNRAPDQLNRN